MKKLLSLVLALSMLMSLAVTVANAAEIPDLYTYETTNREQENFNILNTEEAKDLNVLVNCVTSLLANDASGALVPNAAKEWSSPDNAKTWIFKLNEGMTWVDKDGNVKADVVAGDWVTALEWILNFSKNGAMNTSMASAMIAGAADYYAYTKNLAETEGEEAALALGLDKFNEMVGVKAIDDYTLEYTCVSELPYFPTLCTSACLYPMSAKFVEELGVEGVKSMTWENMWYSGPYTITNYVNQNEKTLTANPQWFGKAEHKTFNSVTVKMVESIDMAYTLFDNGDIDHINLSQSALSTIAGDPGHKYNKNLVEARPTKYSFQMHFVFDKKNEDGTPDTNWNTAIANEAFRKSMYYGLDLTNYLARTNALNPQSCQNYCYTAKAVGVTSDGRDYTDLVKEKLGLQNSADSFNRADAAKAAEYKKQAMEELSAKGVTFPVEMVYYIQGNSQTAKDTADVLTQIFSDCMGDDYIKLVTKTYISSQNKEVRDPQLASIYINGWGADFGDPDNFLGQETYGEDSAYYSNNYSKINNATDEQLIADYKEFTDLVVKARGIMNDMDARYDAYAEAEACFLDHAFTIPMMVEVAWQLTKINDFTKPYAPYGIFPYYYVDWETNDAIYTADDWAAMKK